MPSVGYKVSYNESPKEASKTLPGRIKKPSKMPGTRGYTKKESKERPGAPTRMVLL